MSQSESPRDFYHRLENGLSPLIRLMLAEHLPKIGGRKWWEACVLSSLTPIQLEYVREPENLEQFDFPALVNIVHHNWRTLRPSLGIGNEFTNYLFSLKTLRNEVEHRPDLVLDDERRRHLEQSARLAMKRYTVYATLEYGWRLNELLHQSLYKPDIRHLVVHWRKTDDYTVIPLNAGEARPPVTFAAYRDSRTRPWELKTGWDGCRTPDADAQKRS